MSAALFVVLLLALPASHATDPINLDFEEGLDQQGRMIGWEGGGHGGYQLARDVAIVHGGSASGRIDAPNRDVTSKDYAPLVQWISAQPWRGKRIRLSGWLRTRDVTTGWAGLWMRVDSPTAPALAFDNMPSRGPKGTTAWTRYDVVLDVAPEASEIYLGVILAGNGSVWADDLALEEVPRSVPVTDLKTH
jgi:hypothetical protein